MIPAFTFRNKTAVSILLIHPRAELLLRSPGKAPGSGLAGSKGCEFLVLKDIPKLSCREMSSISKPSKRI